MEDARIVESKVSDDNSITLQPMTKLSVIDYELNRHDMGLYHWLIWAVCGAGFMLDLMWTRAIALTLPIIQREFGFSDNKLVNIGVVYTAGMILGAFTWGVLVDIVGRRVAFFGTALFAGIFGMICGGMSSFGSLQGTALLVGFGTGGNIPVDSTITLEYLPKHRFYLLTALAVFAQTGSVISTIIALAFIPNYSCSPILTSCRLTGGAQPCCSKDANMGWRYLYFTLGSITLGVFIIRFFVFPFYESPKFLASKGDDRGAVEVVKKVATFNKRPCDLTVESLRDQCKEICVAEKFGFSKKFFGEISRVKQLFGSWKMARVTTLIWIIWIFDYGATSIANSFLPTIFQRKNTASNISLQQTYIDFIIINIPGIVSAILSMLMVRSPRIGRKPTLIFASAMVSVSVFLYTVVNTEASRIGMNSMLVFFQLLFDSVLWGWTPEAFPTAVRGTATGMSLLFAVTFSTCGPLAAEQLFDRTDGSNAVLYLSGGSVLVCTLALLCFPTRDMVVSRHV